MTTTREYVARSEAAELTVVIPVFCEAGHVGDVLEGWRTTLDALHVDYVLRVYDDGSSDGTLEILERLAGPDARIEVEAHENRGHGPTILEGYGRARGEWVLQVDSDGEIAPDHFAALWSRREGYDLLLGRRQRSSQPPTRRLTSTVSRLVVRFLFGSGIHDVNSPYRLMRGSALRRLLPRVPADAFAPNVILSGLVIRDGLRVLERDVPVRTRAAGRSSLRGGRLWRGAWRSFGETLRVARSSGPGP